MKKVHRFFINGNVKWKIKPKKLQYFLAWHQPLDIKINMCLKSQSNWDNSPAKFQFCTTEYYLPSKKFRTSEVYERFRNELTSKQSSSESNGMTTEVLLY